MNLFETGYETGYEAFPELAGEFAHEFAPEFAPETGYETGFESGYESAYEWPLGEGQALDALVSRAALEAAYEGDPESLGEWELNPVRRFYPDAAMEHLAHQAMIAESSAQAGEAFLPLIGLAAAKLLPLAMKAAPMIAKAVPKVMKLMPKISPHLTRGVGNIARTLFRAPGGRGLLRSVPSMAQRALGSITRQVAAGRRVTPQTAVRTLARQASGLLRQPARLRAAVRRSQALDARAHALMGSPGGAAAGGPFAGGGGGGGGGCACCRGAAAAAMPSMAAMPMPVPMPTPAMGGGGCACPGQAEYETDVGTLGCGLKDDRCVNHGGCSGTCKQQCKWYWPPPFDICWGRSCKCVK